MSKFCTNCGTSLDDDKLFCTECGSPMSKDSNEQESPPVTPIAPSQPVYQPPRSSKEPLRSSTPRRSGYSADAAPPAGSKYEPISVGGYIGISLLMCIPIVGLILMIVWACGGCRKINKRNFARASLILMAIMLVISLLLGLVFKSVFTNLINNLEADMGIETGITADSGNDDSGGNTELGGILSMFGALTGEENPTNSDIEELEQIQDMLEGATGGESGDWSGLIDGAIEANKDAEAANDGWPNTLRAYPGGTATATASYRTEITGTTLDEMMAWIEDLKGDGFVYQDFYDFGMSEEDMLGINGWWAYDGNTYLSVSYSDGTVIVDHTKELPDLESYFGN